jgi:hypothetical protein
MGQSNYDVKFELFTKNHYIKSFQKKYKSKWLLTELAIRAVCERIDNMLKYNRADLLLCW